VARRLRSNHRPALTFTTCNRPARIGDLDHLVPFPDQPTSADNLHPPCERHHIGKHTAGWQVRRNDDGTTTWISPQGREYTSHPPTRTLDPAQCRLRNAKHAASRRHAG
jgi:hypothetical protein